jgi:hypothetical protein
MGNMPGGDRQRLRRVIAALDVAIATHTEYSGAIRKGVIADVLFRTPNPGCGIRRAYF